MTISIEIYQSFLHDLGALFRKEAFKAKEDSQLLKGKENEAYRIGYHMAWLEAVSLIQAEANAFGIPLSELCLDNLEPERDLL